MTQRPGDGFTPVAPNPYIVGNPVRDRAVFFGRAAEFDLVRRRFHGETRGGLLVFCGERRSGKTSILFQIVDGRLGEDFIPVLIDMQSMAITSEADFLAKVAHAVLAAVGETPSVAAPVFTSGASHAGRFGEFIAAVLRAHPSRRLILLFDEYELFENKIDDGVLSADVLNILASLMEHQSVFMVFTGSQHLEQRRRDYWKILGRSIYKRISYLEREDAIQLIRRPVKGRVEYADAVVEKILRLTAGQAFYTQAVCQNLIDRLNEVRSSAVTADRLDETVTGMVANPLPQMLFLWDSLERDEKLVLALLAEAVDTPAAFVSVSAIARWIRKRDYPLDLDRGHVATALENLFKSEFLLKDETVADPGYAFRMDLWRLWIRRMHSVWQVMRELGMSIRRRSRWQRLRVPALVAVAAAAAVAVVAVALRVAFPPPQAAPARTDPAWLAIEVTPAHAAIFRDGQQLALGRFAGRIEGDRRHEFRIAAAGWADTIISAQVAAFDSARLAVQLTPKRGELLVETNPSGAEVIVDGHRLGRSPISVAGLAIPEGHIVEASLPGRGSVRREVRLDASGAHAVKLVIPEHRAEMFVTTEPAGARIMVDGAERGSAPLNVAGLGHGRVTVSARLAGYLTADTVVEARDVTPPLRIVLREEPPGTMVVQGDAPARIFVDNDLAGDDVPHAQVRVRSGSHHVHVVTAGGAEIDTTFVVRSGERVVFDFTRRSVHRTSAEKP